MNNKILQDICDATITKLASVFGECSEKTAGVSHDIRKLLALLKRAPDMNRKSVWRVKGVKGIADKAFKHQNSSRANSAMSVQQGAGKNITDMLRQNRIGTHMLAAKYGINPDTMFLLGNLRGRVKDFLTSLPDRKAGYKKDLDELLNNMWNGGRNRGIF